MARKILLADDSVTAQNMGRKILADAGYEVIAVNNGSAALKKIAEMKPDLVILDVYMPGYSGLEVCQRLKESPETARIPVLLTVGKLEPFKPEEAKRVRAEGFIVKPFEASELLSTLSKLEDKVVPRSEPSKPGRFARAIALAEEASQGRLGVPHAKANTEEKVDDESTIPSATNRDPRSVIEKSEVAARPVEIGSREAAEANVDVGALAAAGVPKDVTAEELAAIAAAAAQIQMAAAVASEAERSGNGFGRPEPVTSIAERSDERKNEDSFSAASTVGANGADATGGALVGEFPAGERRNGDAAEAGGGADEAPVTMAAGSQTQVDGSAADSRAGGSRWAAVSVALEGEEATISLDQEMQKAQAAFSEALSAHSSQAEELGDAPAKASSALEIAGAEEQVEMPVQGAVGASIETVPQAESVPGHDAAFGAGAAELETAVAAASEPVEEIAPSAVAEPSNSYQIISSKDPGSDVEAAGAQPEAEGQHFENFVPTSAVAENPEVMPSNPSAEASVSDTALSSEKQTMPETGAAITESATGAFEAISSAPESSLDPDTVKTSAAAWASWRQVRDTGKSGEATADSGELAAQDSAPEDTIAKAVAAGAEQIDRAEAAGEQNPSDVASIVDSVLADLRPKLMAEISRKMSEKK